MKGIGARKAHTIEINANKRVQRRKAAIFLVKSLENKPLFFARTMLETRRTKPTRHKIVLPKTPMMRKTSTVELDPELSITGSGDRVPFKVEDIDQDNASTQILPVAELTSNVSRKRTDAERIIPQETRRTRPALHHKVTLPKTPNMRKISNMEFEPELSITGSGENLSIIVEDINEDTTGISALPVAEPISSVGKSAVKNPRQVIQLVSDFEPFLQQAFIQINENGKQYLTTQRINDKTAAYMQTENQNKQPMRTSMTSTTHNGLCRPESRLSSSTLRRYPLISRSSEVPGPLHDGRTRSRPVARCRTPSRSADLSTCRSQTPQPASQEEVPNSNTQPDISLRGKSILFPRSFMLLRESAPDADRKPPPSSSHLRSRSPDAGTREPLYNLPTSGRAMIVKQLIEPLDARRRVMLLTRKPPAPVHGPGEDSDSAALGSGPTAAAAGAAAESAGGGGGGGDEAVRSVVVCFARPAGPGRPAARPAGPTRTARPAAVPPAEVTVEGDSDD